MNHWMNEKDSAVRAYAEAILWMHRRAPHFHWVGGCESVKEKNLEKTEHGLNLAVEQTCRGGEGTRHTVVLWWGRARPFQQLHVGSAIATVLECTWVSGQDLDYAGPSAIQASSKRFLFCEERDFVYLFTIISLVLSPLLPHHVSLLMVSISRTAYVPGLPPSLHFSQFKHPQACIGLTQSIFYHQATLWVSQLDGCSGWGAQPWSNQPGLQGQVTWYYIWPPWQEGCDHGISLEDWGWVSEAGTGLIHTVQV